MIRTHELRKRNVLKIEGDNECSHLGCFTQGGKRIWKGQLLDSDAMYSLDYYVHINGTFEISFLRTCRAVINTMHPVPAGNSIITNESSSREKCIGNCTFLPPHKGFPVVLYQQGDSDRCLICGLASALAFFGAGKSAQEIFHLRHGIKDYFKTDWQMVYTKMASMDWKTISYQKN